MVVVVMGVSGSGKSSFGQALASALGWDFLEGDDMHSPSNVEKMRAGIALDDDDRRPWLDHIATWISREAHQGRDGVVTCSALKRIYRDRLRQTGAPVRFVYIRVERSELERRMRQRSHFMPASMLNSQLQALEEPDSDEAALMLSGNRTIDEMMSEVRRWLQRSNIRSTG
ncbi:gluconokinase [Rhodanobacter sp. C05]|nr:gluconokinase [Rhodanobacter sp. C05]